MELYQGLCKVIDWIWGLPMLFFLAGGGLILTASIGCVQVTRFGYIMKHTIFKSLCSHEKKKGISGYQAVAAVLSATLGTGNIVGVGSAIAMGGPGAVFWMWLIGFVAMGTKYCEVLASVKYREPNPSGGWFAGPFMYLKKGARCLPLAYFWAGSLIITLLVAAALHTGSTIDSMATMNIPRIPMTLLCMALIAFVVYGGVKRLVRFTDKLVPLMSLLYLGAGTVIIIKNGANLIPVFASIFSSAFSGHAALGGFTGATIAATIRWGVARGMYSNDAGNGIQSIIHGQADCSHPVEQAIWGVFEVFFDTLVVCTFTALVILITGEWSTGAPGSVLSINAFTTGLGQIGHVICALSIALFAMSTVMAFSTFIDLQAQNLWGKTGGKIAQVLFIAMMFVGGIHGVDLIIPISDLTNALLIFSSLSGLVIMRKILRSETDSYFKAADKSGEKEKTISGVNV